MSVTKSQAIKAFLMERAPRDLADLYSEDMEVQVTVAKDGGERTEGDFRGKVWHGYTDGIQIWKPIRIPRNANTVPEYEATPMTYDLAAHAEGIGMTGWDWRNRLSRWVAFDFDAIVGHSEKHSKKLSEAELAAIQNCLMNMSTVTIRKSTGGKGLHLYVFLEPTHTDNHNEHAAVARAVLSQLSGLAGFDFLSKVDICGGNMWVWHRKLAGTDGLTILKQGTQLAQPPSNWRDYTKVVSGRRLKNLPRFIEEQVATHHDIESLFEELTGQRVRVQPDEEHKRVMNWIFENYGSCSWWDAEHHMLVTHTIALKEAHSELVLRGKFDTNATGRERGSDYNCYAFPLARGAWAVRRYTLGVAEHAFWEQDGAGWTRCTFNRDPDLGGASRINGGIERQEGGYWFSTAEEAQKAALLLGANLELPNWILGKPASIKQHKSGRLLVEIEKDANCPQLPGWLVKGKKFERLFNIRASGPSEADTFKLDESLRHLVGEDSEDAGWVIKSDSEWHGEPFQHVRVYLQGLGYQPKDVSAIMGSNIEQCWRLVNRPFKDEYPRDRQWNRNAAQLRFKPSLNRDQLSYPSWMRVLKHIGAGLDDAVRANPWCRANGVQTGADWLKCWIASIFQEPNEPLPYIFLYGPQDSGKSILHEAISLLVTRGVVRADTALTSQSGFNGELENAVLCVVEETNLQKNAVAYNRIKDWVTGRQLPVHRKQRQPYSVQNTTHWLQAANSHLACPIFPGDTRITMILVDSLAPDQMIPKKQFLPMLEREAPDFTAELLALEIPQSNDRLNVPCIATDDKALAEQANRTFLEVFLEERCYYAPGHRVKFGELYARFQEWLDPQQATLWSSIRVGREIPPKFAKARLAVNNEVWVGNISFEPVPPEQFGLRYVVRDGKLMQDEFSLLRARDKEVQNGAVATAIVAPTALVGGEGAGGVQERNEGGGTPAPNP